MITYLIEVSICWLLFYVVYILLLSKETFFKINRWYLLSTLLLGLIIPMFTIDFVAIFYQEPVESVVYLADSFSDLEYVIAEKVAEAEGLTFSWVTCLLILYLMGVLVTFSRFLYGIKQIYQLYKSGTLIKKGNYYLVLTRKTHLPFSFFKYLFWNEDTTLEDIDSGKIITHELAHINQWHSLDVLFLELLGILVWFSPPIYWYKKSLRAVHEYLADAYVLRNTKKKQYGHLLIRQVQSGMQISLANHFIHSQLKKRINMMTRNKSRRKALMRYLPALPLLLLMFFVFANKQIPNDLPIAKASLESPQKEASDFDPAKVKLEMIKAYEDYNVNGEVDQNKIVYSRMKQLYEVFRKWSYKYPENKKEIGTIAITIAKQKGYVFQLVGNEFLYYESGKTPQNNKSKKWLVVNHQPIGLKENPIPESDSKSTVIMGKEQAMAKYGKENGKNGAIIIHTDAWTVVNPRKGGAIIVKTEKALSYNDSEHFFMQVDEMPRFPGCDQTEGTAEELKKCSDMELLKFIYTQIQYPQIARDQGIQGTIVIQFLVEKDGSISNPNILRNVGGGTGEEALRVVNLMNDLPTKWTPGRINGKPVTVQFNLPVKFKIEENEEQTTEATTLKDAKPKSLIIINGEAFDGEFETLDPEKIATIDILGGEDAIKEYGDKGKNGVVKIQLKKGISLGEMVGEFKDKIILKDGALYTGDDSNINKDQVPEMHIMDAEKMIDDKKTAAGEPIYKVVERMPLFPGCAGETDYSEAVRICANNKLLEFIYTNITYPKEAKEKGIEGTIVISFLVEKDGTISNAEISRNIGGGTGKEALRVVNLMQEKGIKWIPGQQAGKNVNVKFNLPVKFKFATESDATELTEQETTPNNQLTKGDPSEAIALTLSGNTLKLNAFPNPTKEQLTVTLEGKAKNVLLTVFDMTGKEFFRHHIQTFDGTFYKTIELQNTAKGTLIVNVHHKGKDYQKKIIVQ